MSPWYDSMVAKLIAWGEDRDQANRRLMRLVDRAWMPGVVNNLPLLRQVLAHPAWQEGALDTHFLERHGLPEPPPLNLIEGALAATALGWWQRREARTLPVPPGWRLHGSAEQTDVWRCGESVATATWWGDGAGGLRISVAIDGGEPVEHGVSVWGRDGDWLDLEVDGLRARWRVLHHPSRPGRTALDDGDTVYVHTGQGEAFVRLEPRFPAGSGADEEPGSAIAPTPGTVTAVHVAVGDVVDKGARLVTLEAMKMEHAVVAAQAGEVAEVRVQAGDTVDEGALLVRVVDPQ